MYFFAPLPEEQQAIAEYLDDETAKIDALITHTQEEIALLKELRAATIADAVLGRVDVLSLSLNQYLLALAGRALEPFLMLNLSIHHTQNLKAFDMHQLPQP